MRIGLESPEKSKRDHDLIWGWVLLATLFAGIIWNAAGLLERVSYPCPLRQTTGIPCPTCGATRSWVALMDGRLPDSLRFNPIAALAYIGSSIYALYAIGVAHFGIPRVAVRLTQIEVVGLRCALIAVVTATWVFLIADGR